MADFKKSDKPFSEKITDIIKHLNSVRPLINKECSIMDEYIKNHPNSKAESPFKEKTRGWEKILIGLDIVKDMYEVDCPKQ